MSTWQERLVAEESELKVKLDSLDAFLDTLEYEELPINTRILLRTQYVFMEGYHAMLVCRIESLDD